MKIDEKSLKNIVDKIIVNFSISEYLYPFGVQTFETNILIDNREDIPSPGYFDIKQKKIKLNLCMINNFIESKDDKSAYAFLLFLIFHELSHVVLLHDKRMNNRNIQLWNIATDYMINTSLVKFIFDKFFKINNHQINADDMINVIKNDFLYNREYFLNTEEEIYNKLLQNVKDSKTIYEDENMIVKENDKGQRFIIRKNKIDGESEENDSSDNSSGSGNYNNNIGEMSNMIFKDMIKEKMKGDISSDISNFLKKMIEVKIDWKKILDNALKSVLIKTNDITWSRPRNTSFSLGIYMPGYDTEEKYNSVLIAVDESGSISDEDIQKAVSIIYQSRKYFSKLIVIKHDTIVKDIKEFDIDDINNENHIVEYCLKRRSNGGTSHMDVFDRLKDIERRENIDITILITDGYSDLYDVHKKYSNKIKSRVICLLNSFDEKINNEIPYKKIYFN